MTMPRELPTGPHDQPHSMTEPATDFDKCGPLKVPSIDIWIALTKNGPRPYPGQRVLVVDNHEWKQAIYLKANDTFRIDEERLMNVTHWRPVTLPEASEPDAFEAWWQARRDTPKTEFTIIKDLARDAWEAGREKVEASLADLRYERNVLTRDIERATYDRQGWRAQCERAEAAAAAMRETLGLIRQRGMWGREDEFLSKIDSALATDAGRDWVPKSELDAALQRLKESGEDYEALYERAHKNRRNDAQ